MKKNILIIIFIFNSLIVFSQLDEYSVMGIPTGTTAEITAVTPLEEGALAFDTVTKKLMVFNGANWVDSATGTTIVSANDDNQIEEGTDGGAYLGPIVYTGSFIIDYNDVSQPKEIDDLPFKPSQITFIAYPNIEDLDTDNNNGINGNNSNNTPNLQNTFGTMNGYANITSGTIDQAVIFIGGSGSSINNISRYSSKINCIGIRYTNNNGQDLGKITASLITFDSNAVTEKRGFTISVTYIDGNINTGNGNSAVRPSDVNNEKLVVFYTAYK